MRRLLALCMACFSGSLSACSPNSTSAATRPDAASMPAAGAAGTVPVASMDAGGALRDGSVGAHVQDPNAPPPCNGDPPIMQVRDLATNLEMDPDWSCYQNPSMTPVAAARSVAFHLDTVPPMHKDVLPTSWFANVTADFFFGSSTLGAPPVSRTFDGTASSVMFEIPAGGTLVSAHLHAVTRDPPSLSIPEIREYSFAIPATNTPIEGSIFIRDMIGLAVNTVLDNSEPADPAKSTILAYARDCRGRDVSGAQFELIDGATDAPVPTGTTSGLARNGYFYLALPNTTCTFTDSTQAIWMLVDAPVNVTGGMKTHSHRLRLKGRMRASDAQPVMLGEQEVELFAGTTSMVRLFRETPQ